MQITILGAGNYGTALAKVLSDQDMHQVRIWNWEGDPAPLDAIESQQENTAYLPGVALSDRLTVARDIVASIAGAELIIVAVPSHVCMRVMRGVTEHITPEQTVLVATKGFCKETALPLPIALRASLAPETRDSITVMTGPAIAKELAAGVHTCMQVAGYTDEHTHRVLSAFQDSSIYLCKHTDVAGLSIGGAFKNVYAIALGMCDGLGMSLNTKSAMLVFAMEELTHVARVLGGDPHTVYGLSGLGDMIGTGLSPHSRNRRFGEYVVQDQDIDIARERVGQVVEGLDAVEILLRLGETNDEVFPFVSVIKRILDAPASAREEILLFIDQCTIA